MQYPAPSPRSTLLRDLREHLPSTSSVEARRRPPSPECSRRSTRRNTKFGSCVLLSSRVAPILKERFTNHKALPKPCEAQMITWPIARSADVPIGAESAALLGAGHAVKEPAA